MQLILHTKVVVHRELIFFYMLISFHSKYTLRMAAKYSVAFHLDVEFDIFSFFSWIRITLLKLKQVVS